MRIALAPLFSFPNVPCTFVASMIGFFVPLIVSTLAAETPMQAPKTLQERAHAIRQYLRKKMIDSRRGLVFTRIRNGDPLEDCSLYGGQYLGALVDAWELTHDDETKRLALLLFSGLMLNASVSKPGFLARGVCEDLQTYRGDPSVDQYTGFFYGLTKLHQSDLASRSDKKKISRVLNDILKRLQRDHYIITVENHSHPTTFGHLERVQPTRAERLLSFLLAGAVVTGNEHWRKEYERLRPPRMDTLKGFDRYESWVLIQSAMSFDLLRQFEKRADVRRRYDAACANIAKACEKQVAGYREFLKDPRPVSTKLNDRRTALKTIRIPVEAVATIMLIGSDEQARSVLPTLRTMLETFPITESWYSPPLVSLECAYWWAAKRGLVETQSPSK